MQEQKTDAERFFARFTGNHRSYGKYHPGSNSVTTEKEAATLERVSIHFGGQTGLGIVPVMDDGTCWFGAIDIDNHGSAQDIDLVSLEERVRGLQLPLVCCRSKSGGVHAYLFGREPLKASLVRSLLTKWAVDIGFPGREIFPKQSRLVQEGSQKPTQLGNWINLPYFNIVDENGTKRYAVVRGENLTLREFLDYADTKAVSMSGLEMLASHEHPEAPPCVQRMLADGVTAGARNEALYNISIYMKRAFPDTFKDKAFDANNKVFEKPLPHGEAKKCINSASRRDYKYRCSIEPCKSLCDRKMCLTRQFGISTDDLGELESDDKMPAFEGLIKYNTEPVKWGLKINDVLINDIMTIDLLNFAAVRVLITERLMMAVPPMANKKWFERHIEPMMATARVMDMPEEAGTIGALKAKLMEFIRKADLTSPGTERADRKAIIRGLPVVTMHKNERLVAFRGNDFIAYLRKQKGEDFKGPSLWFALQKAGVGVGHTKLRIDASSTVNVWTVPVGETNEVKLDAPDFDPEF